MLRRAGESGAHAGGYGFRLEGYGPLLSEGPYASKLHPGKMPGVQPCLRQMRDYLPRYACALSAQIKPVLTQMIRQ